MSNQDAELLKKAEELETESKIAIKNKDYSHAISRLLVAKEIYAKLGLTGQVGIIIRDVVRLKNLQAEQPSTKSSVPSYSYRSDLKPNTEIKDKTQNTEAGGNELLEDARSLALDDNLDEALKEYEKAYEIFNQLKYDYECRQILSQINEIKEYERRGASLRARGVKVNVNDIVSLASAERRRLRIQEQLVPGKKSVKTEKALKRDYTTPTERSVPKIFEQRKLSEKKEEAIRTESQSIMQNQQEQLKIQRKEKHEKLRMLKEKKKQEELIVAEAERLLDKGNQMLQRKDYNEAKKCYQQSIELFISLGWTNQVTLLQNELRNIDRYKKEEELKLEQFTVSKLKSEQDFQQKVTSALTEQQRLEEKERLKRVVVPPDIRNKLEKVRLVKLKADKEEQANNFARVLSRYEYILNVYNSIPQDIIDLSQEISNIEAKINDVKSKL